MHKSKSLATSAKSPSSFRWSWLQRVNMTQGKTKPIAASFKECMQAGSETMGFYRDGMVYFKEDTATAVTKYLLQTALEEVAHYVTGAGDISRDLQDFAFKFATEAKSVQVKGETDV